MSVLVVAGITVPVLEGQAVERQERIGVSVRAVDDTLRSAYTSEWRVWQVTTGLLLKAEVDAIVNAATLGAHVACSGDLLGGAATCEVTVGDQAIVNVEGGDGTGMMRTVALVLREATGSDSSPVITDTSEWVL